MTLDATLIASIDDARRALGFLPLADTMALADRGNLILDPFSVLIACRAEIGRDNVFHPGVTLSCEPEAALVLADGNILRSGTLIAAETGAIRIGSGNRFGDGGFTARANRPGAAIAIGDGGRYLSGATIQGRSTLGSGSQVLGAITVDDCSLGAGAPFSDPDPDARGAVLKGAGTARGLTLDAGQVIAGSGVFRIEDLKPQSFFHPKP
jgi:hypothetical protein